MAAVTLKDLMDPLSKLAAAAEATNDKLDAFVAMATGNTGGGLDAAIVTQLEAQTEYLKLIYENTKGGGLRGLFSGRSSKKEKKSAAETLQALGLGAKATAQGMLLWMLVPQKAVDKFVDFVTRSFEKLAEQDTKKVKKGIDAVDAMGGAILKFSKALALSAILLIPGMIAIPFLIVSIAIMGTTFGFLGRFAKPIRKGARALDRVGDAITSFAIGLAAFALTTMFILMAPQVLLGMVASLVLIGGAVALLGLFSKPVRKGARALFAMGVGLAFFGIGYAIFALTVKGTTLKEIGIQAGVLLGVGIATGLLGLAWSYIIQGAISLAAMGVGLLIFGLGYVPFAYATKDATLESVGVQMALLLGLGVEFAAAGFGALFILAGAAAYAAIGGALLILAPGLSAIQKVNFTKEDSEKLVLMLSGVKTAFLGTDGSNEGGVSGFFKKVGGAITGAVDAVRMVEAAAGFTAAGLALMSLSAGLKKYKQIDWTEEDSLTLTTVLSGITTAFAQAGGEGSNPGGLFGAVFGNFFSPNAVQKGISSVMDAGKALTRIAEGLKSFQALVDQGVKFGDTSDPENDYGGTDTMAYAVINTVGFIQQAFSAVADQGNVQAGGFFNTLFGIKKNKVAEGISAVKNAGKTLTSIAEGLKGFQKLIDQGVKFGDTTDPEGDYGGTDTLAYAVINTVGFINQAFSAVADQGNVPAGGFWGTLFGIKRNKVEEGIRSVRHAGDTLDGIAKGLMGFQELINSGVKFGDTTDPENDYGGKDTLAYAVINTVGFVSQAFAAVADQGEVDAGGVFGTLFGIKENKVKKGIESVQGVGTELDGIAKGLQTFQKMVEDDLDFSKGGALSQAVVNSISFVSDAFAAVASGKNVKKKSTFFGLIKYEENLVQKGIKKIKGAGSELRDIANALSTFDGLENPKETAKYVKTAITMVGEAFMAIAGMKTKNSADLGFFGTLTWSENAVKKGIKNVKGAGDELNSIAEGLSKFDGMKNPTKVAITIATLFTAIGTTFSEFYGGKKGGKHFSARMDNFSSFIQTIGDAGENGKLMKAAEGMDAIAKAVNSVEIPKADAFGKLFKASGELQSNREAYMALANAITEIKEALAPEPAAVPATEGGEGGAPAAAPSAGLGRTLSRLNSTMGQLNSTMGQLPASIQSIKIVVPE